MNSDEIDKRACLTLIGCLVLTICLAILTYWSAIRIHLINHGATGSLAIYVEDGRENFF